MVNAQDKGLRHLLCRRTGYIHVGRGILVNFAKALAKRSLMFCKRITGTDLGRFSAYFEVSE